MKRLISKFPILGGLMDCKPRHHARAFGEFVITILFATATFWMSALFLSVTRANRNTPFLEVLSTTYSKGELLVFCVSVLGVIFYTALDEPAGAREFPSKRWHTLLVFCLGFICAGLYAMTRVGGTDVDVDRIVALSIILAAVATALRYLTLVYHGARQDSDVTMKDQEKRFAADYTGPKE